MTTTMSHFPMTTPPRSWSEYFKQVPADSTGLLTRLSEFPDAVLVTGCQRSGTTALAETLMSSSGITSHVTGHDSELDGACILRGWSEAPGRGRRCFQTTYVNHDLSGYFQHPVSFRLIILLRNPQSTIQSMVYNWMPAALTYVARECGYRNSAIDAIDTYALKHFGGRFRRSLRQSIHIYKYKYNQIIEISEKLPPHNVFFANYEDILRNTEISLRSICEFASISWDHDFVRRISKSKFSKQNRLSPASRILISEKCDEIYSVARSKTMT